MTYNKSNITFIQQKQNGKNGEHTGVEMSLKAAVYDSVSQKIFDIELIK